MRPKGGWSKAIWEFLEIEAIWGVSGNWRVHFLGVLTIRALVFGVCIRAPDCWKLPYTRYAKRL